jgi:hypothetical protein
MHGTPGFICGGAADFGLKALYLPIRCGGYEFRSNCYAYGRDSETTDHFTIRCDCSGFLWNKRACEAGYSAVGFTGLENGVAG